MKLANNERMLSSYYNSSEKNHDENRTQAKEEYLDRIEKIEKRMQGFFGKIEKRLESKAVSRDNEYFIQEIQSFKSLLEESLHAIAPNPHSNVDRSLFSTLQAYVQNFIGFFFSSEHKSIQINKLQSYDPFGRDPEFENMLKPFFDFLYYKYWRINTYGLENIPNKGRGLLVANHSGALPWDGSMIRVAVTNDHPAGRDVRFLVEDFVYYLPFVGTYMYRVGGVRASRDNAEQLLNSDHLVAVFPEGVKGIGKHFSKRYHLQRFGRGGFIKLALKTNSPIIPVAIIGAEEIHPILYKSSLLAKPFGIPYIPITPTLPWLGLLGLVPLPTKWSIYFGEPIHLRKFKVKNLDDDLHIHKISEIVRQRIQKMISEGLKNRRSVWR